MTRTKSRTKSSLSLYRILKCEKGKANAVKKKKKSSNTQSMLF